jgi:SAM-dependent methyltransferase
MAASLSAVLKLKYGPLEKTGWGPRLRSRFGYQTPDDWYEATLFQSVTKATVWLDVGCGRFLLGSNHPTAKMLAERCRHLVGLDPSDNIDDNPYVHERAKSTLEAYQTDRQFDLITLRMVAEHICNPEAAVAALSRLTKPGGQVVIYTISKWSPASLVAAATPMSVHHAAKHWLWRTEERDTYPIAYKMNTRGTLRRLFAKEGFREEWFRYLDDCRSFQRWKISNIIELSLWKILHKIGVGYPEACILAIYRFK